MALSLVALLFVGFLTTSAISYLVSRNSIRTSILRNELPLSSNSIYSEIQRDLFEPILISSLMANDTFVKDWILNGETDQGEINRYLAHIERKYGTTTAFLVSEKTRRYYNRSGVLKVVSETNPADKWYFRVRKMNEAHEMNVDPDLSNKATMSIFVNFRIVTPSGKYLGATGVGLEVRALKALMREYRSKFHRDIYFYDRSGKLVLHSLTPEEEATAHHHFADPTAADIFRRVAAGEKEASASAVGHDGALINYRYLPELDWLLVVEQVSDGTRNILFKMVAINLAVCLLLGLILARLIQRIALRYQKRLEEKNFELESHQTELRQANAARERLFAIIGHDLRTPMANLKSSLELLSDGTMEPSVWRSVRDDLRRGVNFTLGTLENLMEWGSLQSRTLKPQAEPIGLLEAADEAIALLGLAAREKEITVRNHIPFKARVAADPRQLASIFRNLLSNAIKFTPRGGQVDFDAAIDGRFWRISIADNGAGIDAERIRALLKDGTLPTRRTVGRESGLGLGLLLCRDFITANGGVLEARSEPGKGSVFTFTLPVAQ